MPVTTVTSWRRRANWSVSFFKTTGHMISTECCENSGLIQPLSGEQVFAPTEFVHLSSALKGAYDPLP
jgi:hypothetical protein